MSLSQSITSLRSMLDTAENEIKSLEGGRKASSARSRLSLQQIKKQSHSLRKDITKFSQALPTKTRVKKVVDEPVTPEPAPEPEPVKKERKPRTKKVKPEVAE
jgi:Tfp pilus assembly protein PilO